MKKYICRDDTEKQPFFYLVVWDIDGKKRNHIIIVNCLHDCILSDFTIDGTREQTEKFINQNYKILRGL